MMVTGMGKKLNIDSFIGKTYSRLTVVRECEDNLPRKARKVWCTCSCGRDSLVKVALIQLRNGQTKTCGCSGMPSIGSVLKNSQGLEFKVLAFVDGFCRGGKVTKIRIKFLQTGYERDVMPKEVKTGALKDLMYPSIAGVGYVGEGAFKTLHDHRLHYQTWLDMIKRCYKPKDDMTAKTYKDITVCKEWYNYQNFAKWFDENYIEGFELDKDFKVLGNKVYSPTTCVFLPAEINGFLTGGLKRGIHFCNSKGKWVAQCQNGEVTSGGKKRQTYLGVFDNELSALNAYKTFKLDKLRVLREKYIDIDTLVFNNIEWLIINLK